MKSVRIKAFVFGVLFLSILAFCSLLIPPHRFYLAGILSLTIPFFILINIAALLYFSMQRSYWFILPLVILAFAGTQIANTFSFRKSTQPLPQPRLSILTYNSNKLASPNNQGLSYRDRLAFRNWVERKGMDIVCLQEMLEFREHPFQLPGYYKIFSGKITEEGHRLGLFIFSKYPVVREGKIEFGVNSFNRLIWADVVAHQDTIRIVTVHFKSYNFQGHSILYNLKQLRSGIIGRSEHAAATFEFIQQSPYPVILAGDFNEAPYSYTYRKISAELTDTFIGSGLGYQYTYKVKRKLPFRIDYIFTSHHFNSDAFTVHHDVTWSDHFPVSVQVRMK